MKHYFFVRNLSLKIAGIESATIKRMELFQEMNEQAIIATATHNPVLKRCVETHGIAFENVMNIYSYYQKFTKPEEPYTIQFLQKKQLSWRFEKMKNSNAYRVYNQAEEYTMYVSCFKDDIINYINFFDSNKKKYKRIICDEFGNQSCEILLDAQQNIIYQRYLDVNGNTCIEEYFALDSNNKNTLTTIHLIYNGKLHIFKSQAEFLGHWLSDLADEGPCVFYIDRNLPFSHAIPFLSKNVPVYSILHSGHVRTSTTVEEGPVKRNYERALKDSTLYAGYIVSTEFQKRDIVKRFDLQKPVYAIPVGYKIERAVRPMGARTKNKIVIPSRFSPEKRLPQIIEAIAIVQKTIPDVQVHLFGFNTSPQNVLKQIQDLVKENQLEQHVFTHDFTTEILKELDDASAYLLTSIEEGFCLTLLEALSCGVPSFSYDIRYGPSDMIQHGFNGFLIENENVEQMAKLLSAYLKDEELKQKMSNSAYEWANLFNKDEIKRKWQMLIKEQKPYQQST